MVDSPADTDSSQLARVSSGEHPISYLDTGPRSSTAVVLLHSLGTDHRLWRAQIPELSRQHRVIAPDLGGAGSAAAAHASVPGWVTDVRQVLDHAGVDHAVLVGISLGGIQAIAFAAEHPERVVALVVADSFVELDPGVAERKIEQLAGQARREGMAALADSYVEDTFTHRPLPAAAEDVRSAIAATDQDAYIAAAEACFTVRIADRLAQVTAPTLVLWGDRDAKAPRALSERIAAGIAGAELVQVADAGHLANIENAEQFTRLVSSFIAEHAQPFVHGTAGGAS